MGFHLQRRKKCFEILLKKYSKGHLGREKGFLNQDKNLLNVIDVMDGVMGGKNAQPQKNLNWRELVGAVIPSNLESSGSILAPTPGQSQ